jgi:hypothetical protein
MSEEWQKTRCARSYNVWRYTDDTKEVIEIRLTKGNTTIIDAADKDLVMKDKWFSCKGYAKSNRPNWRSFGLHQLIMGAKNIDHASGNKFDNRRCNLRKSTDKEQSNNRCIQVNNKSGVNGVYEKEKRRQWIAQWNNAENKQCEKVFSYNPKSKSKDTNEQAFQKACAHRKAMDLITGSTNGQRPKKAEQSKEFMI